MRTLPFVTFLIAGCLATATSLACINETGTTRSGHRAYVMFNPDDLENALRTPSGPSNADVAWARQVTAEARKEPSYDNLNQLAVVLMRLGKPREAAALLEHVEKRFPNQWQTAPNLGTAYELSGDNERALRWIREGMRRNPGDHEGSEWLHVAILEAKISRRPRVLDLDFGPGPLPRRPVAMPVGNDGRPLHVKQLGDALQLQLQERAQFVPAPEPLMAGLLFDFAQLQLVDGTMEAATVLYEAADRYGYSDKLAIRNGLAEAKRVRESEPIKGAKVECPLCRED